MSATQEIFTEYVRMRENGLDTKEALRALRVYIEGLPSNLKDELAQHLRAWERGSSTADAPSTSPPEESDPVIKPLRPRATETTTTAVAVAVDEEDTRVGASSEASFVACPNCEAKNQVNEVFCYACGHMLDNISGAHDTRHFAAATDALYSPDYFSMDSVLRLNVRDRNAVFELRPQLRNHELVVGRKTDNSPMAPDIDLSNLGASEAGVSRLHVALRYEGEDSALQIYDLGSSNGTFVNGQRLHPREVRILRNGDQLRLGKLVVLVSYQHPGEELMMN
ncbi:MAG: FHA domain-containing protein [Anaerolineae bacterium]|nr:FHA domain-containing protein [Anaerolineae bacterium]MCA9890946.1 FHA domain-containing protein [Anaerolineae bacterium]MCA9892801.1 FHA domain-containing protein [Anaerolineae bacterium]MCB9458435.1 FHA domain-containing protein [Anaerolineaceae bacterium]